MVISNEKDFMELFNESYIDIVVNAFRKKPSSRGNCSK